MPLQLLTVIVLGLMGGSGMNIAVFGHPTLNKQPLEVHIPVRASFAKLFGRIMPYWMRALSDSPAQRSVLNLFDLDLYRRTRLCPRME